MAVLECGVCAGLWLGADVFRTLEDRARKIAPENPDPIALRAEVTSRAKTPQGPGPAYRPCPACRKRMNRINFERVSGILLDRCRDHGIWFDAAELDAVMRWIKLGGEHASEERRQEEDRARASQLKFKVEPKNPDEARAATFANTDRESGFDAIPAIVNWLLKL